MIERSLLLRLASLPGSGKNDSYAFESGREGLTAQVRRLGLFALVVGRDGRGFDVPEWPESVPRDNQDGFRVKEVSSRYV